MAAGGCIARRGLEFLHLADLSRPHSPASEAVQTLASDDAAGATGVAPILDSVPGVVMLTQTCDVVRDCRKRPFVEVAPLVELSAQEVEKVHRLKSPAFAYVPGTAKKRLVADLDRTMTVEKAVVANGRVFPAGKLTKRFVTLHKHSAANDLGLPFPMSLSPPLGDSKDT